jgi:hypothetical protein
MRDGEEVVMIVSWRRRQEMRKGDGIYKSCYLLIHMVTSDADVVFIDVSEQRYEEH